MESVDNLKTVAIAAKLSVCFIGFTLLCLTYRLWINGNRYRKPMSSKNKVVIITGASKGIGRATALNLARRGAHVIMACRDTETGTAARNEIIEITGNPNVKCMHLDLGSFKSIRAFADDFLKLELPLNVLINNANVFRMKRELTEDGLEQTIGINYFGNFLLTMLLMKRLSESTPSRIINMSNWIHRCVGIDRMDLMNEREYSGYLAYARSQLANIYFSLALSKRLENMCVTCNMVHTGISLASFFERLDDTSPFYLPKWLLVLILRILLKSEEACAESLAFAAFDFSLQTVSGLYVSDAQIGRIGDNTNDTETMEWLFKKSEEITGEKYIELSPWHKRNKVSKLSFE